MKRLYENVEVWSHKPPRITNAGYEHGRMWVTFTPPDIRFDTIYDLLGEQAEPNRFALGERLQQTLFADRAPQMARVCNISERHLGLEERMIGWTFFVEYVPADDCPCFC